MGSARTERQVLGPNSYLYPTRSARIRVGVGYAVGPLPQMQKNTDTPINGRQYAEVNMAMPETNPNMPMHLCHCRYSIESERSFTLTVG